MSQPFKACCYHYCYWLINPWQLAVHKQSYNYLLLQGPSRTYRISSLDTKFISLFKSHPTLSILCTWHATRQPSAWNQRDCLSAENLQERVFLTATARDQSCITETRKRENKNEMEKRKAHLNPTNGSYSPSDAQNSQPSSTRCYAPLSVPNCCSES